MRPILLALLMTASNACLSMSAQELVQKCEYADKPGGALEYGYCMGFIDGVTDNDAAYVFARMFAAGASYKPSYCIPNGVTLGQMRAVFMKHMRDHPQDLHFPAQAQVLISLQSAFPCQQ